MTFVDSDMSESEFRDIVKDIASFFGNPRDRQMEILYDIFRAYPYDRMKKACRYLIEHHDSRYFPTPHDIHDALREVAEMTTERPEEFASPEAETAARCPSCRGIGWSIETRRLDDYTYYVAVYCDCEKGQKLRQGHGDYLRRRIRG